MEACGNAVWAVPLFNACGIAWRLSTLLVIRHGSATLAFMANALLLPVTDMFFDSSIIGNGHARPRVCCALSVDLSLSLDLCLFPPS